MNDERNAFLKNGVKWIMDSDFVCLFEIETEKIVSFLPKGVNSVEIRPGISAIAIGSLTFPSGNLGNLPKFNETNWAILVQPDLSKKMPLPNFCFFLGNVGADCEDFLEHTHRVDKMNIYHSESIQINLPNSREAEVRDNHGLAYSLKSTCPSTNFQEKILWGQIISLYDNHLYVQAWKWEGRMLEYQKNCDIGEVYNHPYFRGLDVSNIGKNCYIQLLSDPATEVNITFYEPVRLREQGATK